MAKGLFGVARSRPRLTGAAIIGVCVGVALLIAAPDIRGTTAFTAGWNAFCLVFLGSTVRAIWGRGPEHIRASATRQDEGRHLILGLVLAASVASLVAVAGELSYARQSHGMIQAAHVAAAFWAVAASWLTVQAIFALHYAHEYYSARGAGRADSGGLVFPGGEAPDYWDFLHFSVVIGVAAQTADIAITAKPLRRLATLHSLVAFAFNTVVVALTISLLAGLF